MRTAVLTAVALAAFAANSILCRAALGSGAIDAGSFSAVRLLSGALVLALLMRLRPGAATTGGSWSSAALLFLYAVPFSFAYNTLSTGTGALVLFGAVQATMLTAAVMSGERPGRLQWAGLLTAIGGLVYLVLPGVSAPSPLGSALMALAGFAWALYSLRGRATADPLAETAGNFMRSLPWVALVASAPMFGLGELHVSASGVVLATASGALASGIGYAVWYAALTGLTATVAATVQLSVPVLAAVGGVVFMAEGITERLLVASLLILGGVGTALFRPRAPAARKA